MVNCRIGHGYDVHKLVSQRRLIIGGVEIEHELGLLGHSDADVLVHAIMDALLGAMGLDDIGKHFPDTDEKYKGISSISLLSQVYQLMTERGYAVVNIDATVILQRPTGMVVGYHITLFFGIANKLIYTVNGIVETKITS